MGCNSSVHLCACVICPETNLSGVLHGIEERLNHWYLSSTGRLLCDYGVAKDCFILRFFFFPHLNPFFPTLFYLMAILTSLDFQKGLGISLLLEFLI